MCESEEIWINYRYLGSYLFICSRALATLGLCLCVSGVVLSRACVCMWSTFHKIKDDIDSVTSRERAVGNDSCPFNRCPEETGTPTLFVEPTF